MQNNQNGPKRIIYPAFTLNIDPRIKSILHYGPILPFVYFSSGYQFFFGTSSSSFLLLFIHFIVICCPLRKTQTTICYPITRPLPAKPLPMNHFSPFLLFPTPSHTTFSAKCISDSNRKLYHNFKPISIPNKLMARP